MRASLSGILTYLKKDYINLKGVRSFLESWKTGFAEADGVSAPDPGELLYEGCVDGCSRTCELTPANLSAHMTASGPLQDSILPAHRQFCL